MINTITKRRATVTRWECSKFTKSYRSARALAKALLMDAIFPNICGISEMDSYEVICRYPAKTAYEWRWMVSKVEAAVQTLDFDYVEKVINEVTK